MSLKKPPLVEVWMSFQFEAAAGAPPWKQERYRLFFDTISGEFPDVQEMMRRGIRVAARRGGAPRIKEVVQETLAMRAFTADGLRCLQLTPDELVVNYLRGEGSSYPGFTAFLDEAMGHCRRYAECYRPIGVLQAALHYVDLVEIPVPEGHILNSEEYFTLNLQVPEDVFGGFAGFDIKATVVPPGSQYLVELVFATSPSPADSPHRRFRLEWHTAVRKDRRMEEDEVRANLQEAHDRLEKCFRHAFTTRGWALFEPEES